VAKRCVLAIEHDWPLRRLIQANLESLGLEVQVAVNAQHGLEMQRTSSPDLILLDTDLPDMESADLLPRLQAQSANQVPIILMSAEPLSRTLGQNRPVTRYLRKPFSAPALLDQVEQALEHMPAK